jgi:hypothetical protein
LMYVGCLFVCLFVVVAVEAVEAVVAAGVVVVVVGGPRVPLGAMFLHTFFFDESIFLLLFPPGLLFQPLTYPIAA